MKTVSREAPDTRSAKDLPRLAESELLASCPNPEDRLVCLAEIAADLNASLKLDDVFEKIAERVKRALDYDNFSVLLLDSLGQELRFRFGVGYPEEVLKSWRFGVGQGLVGVAARTGQSLLVNDVSNDPRFISAGAQVGSELTIPLISQGRVIGVMDVGKKEKDYFTPADLRTMGLFSGHLANAIENARLYENVREQAGALSLLHEASRELASILEQEKLFRKVAELVKRVVDFQLFTVMLWNDRDRVLEHAYSLRFDKRAVIKDKFPLGHGITGTAAALRQSIRVPNVRLDPRYVTCMHEGAEMGSELVVPLLFKDRLIGVLDLESFGTNAFTAQHEQMLSTLASSVAISIENARLYQKVIEDERRLESDLETAREIQKGLLPDRAPEIPGLDIAFASRPARHLGGDFYDFLRHGDGRHAIVAGDVAGKATPAALYGALAVGILRGQVLEDCCTPKRMLRLLNEPLREPRLDNRFVAMVYGLYNHREGKLQLSNAGFTRPWLVRDGVAREIQVEGLPLGLFPNPEYDEVEISLNPGDIVAFSSDGLSEAMNEFDEEFGGERIGRLLESSTHRSASEIVSELLAACESHANGNGENADDRTLIVLKKM